MGVIAPNTTLVFKPPTASGRTCLVSLDLYLRDRWSMIQLCRNRKKKKEIKGIRDNRIIEASVATKQPKICGASQ